VVEHDGLAGHPGHGNPWLTHGGLAELAGVVVNSGSGLTALAMPQATRFVPSFALAPQSAAAEAAAASLSPW